MINVIIVFIIMNERRCKMSNGMMDIREVTGYLKIKEQMEMVKLQILQQTAAASLVQANSAPQIVLSLFQ